jgi:hypothetical protein
LVVLVAAWWAFFRLSVWALDSVVPRDLAYPQPVYVQTQVGTPLADVLDKLFIYGLVGVFGAFVLAVSTGQLKPRWTWSFANGAAALLLLLGLMTQFSLRYGMVPFQAAEDGRYPYLRGTFQYPLSTDLDPFILTEPKSYCQMQKTIDGMDEDETKFWFMKYAEVCPEQ